MKARFKALIFAMLLFSMMTAPALAQEKEQILLWDIPFDTTESAYPDLLYAKTGIVLQGGYYMALFASQEASMLNNRIDTIFPVFGDDDKLLLTSVSFVSDTTARGYGSEPNANGFPLTRAAFMSLYSAYKQQYGDFDTIQVSLDTDSTYDTYSYHGELDDNFWYTISKDVLLDYSKVYVHAIINNITIACSVSNELQSSTWVTSLIAMSTTSNATPTSFPDYPITNNKTITDVDIGL